MFEIDFNVYEKERNFSDLLTSRDSQINSTLLVSQPFRVRNCSEYSLDLYL
jgi:hypothetical protein